MTKGVRRQAATMVVVALTLVALSVWVWVRAQGTGLVGAYPFSEGVGTTTADLSSAGNHGALMNGAGWTANGRFGPAVALDGADDGIRLPANSQIPLAAAFTLQAWIHPTGAHGATRQIIQTPGANGDGLLLLPDGTPRFKGRFPGGIVEVTGPAVLPLNTWTHLAVTYDGAALRLFVNGVEVAAAAATGDLVGNGLMWFGRTRSSGSAFGGTIDEVRLYARALTPAEVTADMNTPVDPSTTFAVTRADRPLQ